MSKLIEQLKAERTSLVSKCMKTDIAGNDEITTTCSRADGNFCSAYAFPDKKWRISDCPLADEFLRTKTEENLKVKKIRVGQQKQKKKSRR